MWFGVYGILYRYDGEEFVSFGLKDGLLCHDRGGGGIRAIYRDPDSVMWLGIEFGGVARYDGQTFVNLGSGEGWDKGVWAIHRSSDGSLWFGTYGSGVWRYSADEFVTFTVKDGLPHDCVTTIYYAPDGMFWFGTDGGGVLMYDGCAWSSLDMRDGLAGNIVKTIEGDPDGSLWFGTDRGITRYRRSSAFLKAYIFSVTTDQTYRDLDAIPAFTVGTRVTIEYSSIDMKTIPEKRQYRCRIYEAREDEPAPPLPLSLSPLLPPTSLPQKRRPSTGHLGNPAHASLRCRL
jgi:streptogramin lyase